MHVAVPTRVHFGSLIVGIATVAKPAFSLMDAVIALEGPGPANGTPTHMGLLLASTDPVALDWAEARIMGYDPEDIPIVREGIRRGLGSRPSTYPLLNSEDLVRPDFQRITTQKRTASSAPSSSMIFGPIIRRNVKRQRPTGLRPIHASSAASASRSVRPMP